MARYFENNSDYRVDGERIQAKNERIRSAKPAESFVPESELNNSEKNFVQKKRAEHAANLEKGTRQEADYRYAKFGESVFDEAIGSVDIFSDSEDALLIPFAESEYDDYANAADLGFFILDETKKESTDPADYEKSPFFTIDVTSTSSPNDWGCLQAVKGKLDHDISGRVPQNGASFKNRRGYAPIVHKSAYNNRVKERSQRYIPVSQSQQIVPHFVVGFSRDTLDIISNNLSLTEDENGKIKVEDTGLDIRQKYMLLRQLTAQSSVYLQENAERLKVNPNDPIEQSIRPNLEKIDELFRRSYAALICETCFNEESIQDPKDAYEVTINKILNKINGWYTDNPTVYDTLADFDQDNTLDIPEIPETLIKLFENLIVAKKKNEEGLQTDGAHKAIIDLTKSYEAELPGRIAEYKKQQATSPARTQRVGGNLRRAATTIPTTTSRSSMA